MGRSRTNTLVLAGVALTVLLGVVALVARGHSAPSGSGAQNRSASQMLANTVFTIWFVAMAIGAVALVYAFAQGRRYRQQQKNRGRSATQLVALFFVLFLLVFAGSRFHLFHRGGSSQRPPGPAQLQKLRQEELKRERHKAIHKPVFEWPIALGIVALLVGGSLTVFLRAKARRSKLVAEVKLIQELREVLDETLDDLRAEADPRKAVIAAYARMERILGAHGLPRRPSEAPQEYLERVLVDLQVTKKSVERLTELFARAKFSQHDVDPQMKEDAIDALVALREQIRTIGATLDKPELELPRLTGLPGVPPTGGGNR
jgi:uncharacterized protein DUF4129